MSDFNSLGASSPSLRPAIGELVVRSRREAPRTPLGPQPQHEQNLTLLRQLRGRWSTLLGSESAAQVSQEAATYLTRLAPQENIQGRELRLLQQMTAGTARPTLSEDGVAQQADPKKAIKDLDRKIKSLSARLSEGGESAGSAKVSRADLQVYGSLQPMKTGTYQGVKTELRSQRETEARSETSAQRPEARTATQGSAAQGSLSEVVQNRTTLPWSRPAQENRSKPPVETRQPEVPKPPVETRKPEVAKPPVETRRPEVAKPPVETRRPEVAKPPVETRRPEVPKPPVETRKPLGPPPQVETGRPEVPKPPVETRKPLGPPPQVETGRPEVPKPPVETRKPLGPPPQVETGRPEVPKPPVETRKPLGPPPQVETGRPEVPKPPVETRKPLGPPPQVETGRPEVPKPPVETRKPLGPPPQVETGRPEVPKPPVETRKPLGPPPQVETGRPEVSKPPVETRRPEVPKPPVETRRPDVPKPPVETRRPEVPKPPVETRRPEVPKPPVETRRPDVPKPPVETRRPDVPPPPVETRRPEVPKPPVETRRPDVPPPPVETRKPIGPPLQLETRKPGLPVEPRLPGKPELSSLATPSENRRPALGPPPPLPAANEPMEGGAKPGAKLPLGEPPKIEPPKAEAAPLKVEVASKKELKPAVNLPPAEDKAVLKEPAGEAMGARPAFAPTALAPVTSVKATTTTQAAENRSKYPDWLTVKLSEDATPAYLTSLPGAQRGPKGIEAQPMTNPSQAVDAVKGDYRRADLREERSAPAVTAQQLAAPPPVAKAAQLFQSVLSQGLIASQKPSQDAPKSSESSSRSRLDEEKDRQKDGIKGVGASPRSAGVAGAGRISGQSEITETRGLQAALSGSVGRREGADQKAPMPNVAAGWSGPPANSEAKLDNGRVVTADIPVYSPVLDELAERSKEAPPARVEREKPRPLFFERSEDNFNEQRFKEEDRGGREALERSGTLPQSFVTAEKQVASKRRDEVSPNAQQHQDKVEDVNDQSGHGGRGGGSQQRERDQQASKHTQQAAEQQQAQGQRRSQTDQKMDLRSLEAYRLAKTDEALKMGLKLAQQPEGKQLSELANRHAGHSMESLLKKAYRLDSMGELSRDDAVNALGLVLKLGGEFTFAHSARVLELAMDLADEVGVTDKETRSQVRLGALLKDTGEMALMLDEAPPAKLEKITDWLGSHDLRQAGLLHDIGKTKVPPEILYKPGKLTEEEYEIMKLHPVLGEQMVYPIESLRHLCPVIRGHHERWDGKGYPDGLKGEDIPYAARIIAVADVFDALAAERPYKAGMPVERVQAILREGRGTHFDPDLLDAFERVIQRRHPELSNPFA